MSWKKFIPSLCYLALLWWTIPVVFLAQGPLGQFSSSLAVSTAALALLILLLEVLFSLSNRIGLIIEWNVILILYFANHFLAASLIKGYHRVGGAEHWEDQLLELGLYFLFSFILYATLGNVVLGVLWSIRKKPNTESHDA